MRIDDHTLLGSLLVSTALLTTGQARADGPPPARDVSLTPPDLTPPLPAGDPNADPPAPGPVEVLPSPHPEKLAALIFGGVAVVGVGVGTAFGVLALNNQSSYDAHPTAGAAHSGNQEAVVADVSLGAAVIAGVTGLVLFLDDRWAPPRASSPHTGAERPIRLSVSPMLGPHTEGAGALLRF